MLPNPGMDAIPFTPLTAEFLDDMIANIEALSDGSGIIDDAITPAKLGLSSVDANGWTVVNFGDHKMAWKSGSCTGGSQIANAAWVLGNTVNLPVGCATVDDIKHVDYAFRMTSNAYALGANIERAGSNTNIQWTATNNAVGTLNFGTPEYWCLVIF